MSDGVANSARPDPARIQTRQDFATMLTSVRVQAGYTVRELAKVVDIPFTTLGGYLRGRHLPTVRSSALLPKILRACGVGDPGEIRQWQQAWDRVRHQPPTLAPKAPVPYLGLSSFRTCDADWFYGRDALIDTVIDRLAAQCTTGGLSILVGPSGSGKSSLLQAGMVPALHAGELGVPGSTGWPVITYTPGEHPLSELASLLAAGCAQPPPTAALPDPDPTAALDHTCWAAFVRAVAEDQALAQIGAQHRVVVVVDQFEELFSACHDERECARFVAALHAMTLPDPAAHVHAPALVVLGLRADFYSYALQHPPIAQAMQDSQVLVGPMADAELRQVITEPAAKAKLSLEDGLTELLLRDLAPHGTPPPVPGAHDVGALPLLSHALQETCRLAQGRRLTVAAYRDSGGIAGAVARTAEAVYDGLTARQQQLTRRLLLRLVNVGDEVPDTRRRVRRQDLQRFADHADTAQAAAVLDQFIARRLITSDLDTVEIAHEVVLRAWPRLRGWIDEDRARLLVGQQVQAAADSWLREHREPAALLQGSRLAAAKEWLATEGEATTLAREFVAAGIHRERRGLRRLYQSVATLCVLLLATVAAGAVAIQQTRSARAERNTAISRLVATRADRLRAKDIPLSMQLSLVAYQIAHTPEATSSLLDSSAVAPATRLLGSSAVMQAVAFSPDRRILAAGSADRSIRLWNVTDPQHPVPLGQPLTGPTGIVYSVAFSLDGRTLAAGGGDKLVWRWDLSTPAHPVALGPPLSGPGALIYSLAFSPDGKTLAAGSGDKKVWLWQIRDRHQPQPPGRPLSGAGSYVQSLAFSPDGAVLAAGGDDHTVRLWNMRAPGGPAPLAGPLTGASMRVYAVAFSPDGATLAVGSADRGVYLWDVRDPAHPRLNPRKLTGPTSWVNALAFSPDGATLAVGSADDTLRLWDLAGNRYVAVLPHPGPVTGIAFGKDQHTVATSAADGVVRIWHLPASPLTGAGETINAVTFNPAGTTLAVASAETRLWDLGQLRPLPVAITNASSFSAAIDFTPDGRVAAIGGRDGSVRLWNVADPKQPVAIGTPFAAHTQLIESLAFGRGGRLLATGGDDNTVRLWDTSDPRHPVELATVGQFAAYVYSVRFSPDGHLLAAASVDDTVRLWDVSDPRHPVQLGAPLVNPDHYQLCVAFSPDGRMLAVGSADNTVTLWNLTDARHPARYGTPLTGPSGYAYAVAFAPDGHTLAAASTDGTVWLWNVADPRHVAAVATLSAATGSLYSVAYSPDGQTLVAGGAARSVWVWDTSAARVATRVCAVVGAAITRAEWAQYVPSLPYQPPCRR